MYKYFKKIGDDYYISSWKFKGFSDEIIKPTSRTDNTPAPALSYIGNKTRDGSWWKFDRSYLKQDKITFTHEKK